jgi:NADH dehydrogenase
MISQRIVIVGGGFAGVTLAQQLESMSDASTEIVVISRDNHLVFTPMLPEVAGRSISPVHVAVPGRVATKRTLWIEATVTPVDLKTSNYSIRYLTAVLSPCPSSIWFSPAGRMRIKRQYPD